MLDQITFSVKVVLKGMSNNKGKLMLALYEKEQDYMKKNFQGISQSFENQGFAEFIFKKIPAGWYSISAFHDENSNGKLDTNFLGIPR